MIQRSQPFPIGTLSSIQDPPIIQQVWSQKSLKEALRLAKTASDVPGIVYIWKLRHDTDIENPVYKQRMELENRWLLSLDLRPWQGQLLQLLEKPPENYKITWYFDREGNTGKSIFLKYLLARDSRDQTRRVAWLNYFDVPRCPDIIRRFLGDGWDCSIFVADVCRSYEDRNIYNVFESIKDGMMTSSKAKIGSFQFPKPHVVVFANFPPDTKKISQTRYVVHDLGNRCLAQVGNVSAST